jgi:hypothetical protein
MRPELAPGTKVKIISGDLRGTSGRVVSVDEKAGTAYLRLWVYRQDGSMRGALAVLALRDVRLAERQQRYPKVTRSSRGRPRTINDQTVRVIHDLYQSGLYSHASIALRLGVSKSSVTAILKRGTEKPSASAE